MNATASTQNLEGTGRSGASILSSVGLPASDDYGLAASPKRFDDGGHFRLEISGVERLRTLETLLEEADARDLFVHRIVAFGAGATLVEEGELRAFAELSRERGIEVVACPGPRSGWDRGRQAVTPEGSNSGRRVRGVDNLRFLLDDYLRIFDAGFRGTLVWDEGVLDILNRAREAGDIPPDVRFKVSVYTGHANPASIRIVEGLGADSLNPVGDLSRPMLAAIRSAVDIPLDVWAVVFESFGGMNRLWEAGEIARVAAPCYFKVEPGDAEGNMYVGHRDEGDQDAAIRAKVRQAAILLELAARTSPDVEPSPVAAAVRS